MTRATFEVRRGSIRALPGALQHRRPLDGEGGYTLADVPAGVVTVTVSFTGYEAASQSVTVSANARVTQDFNLQSIDQRSSGGGDNPVHLAAFVVNAMAEGQAKGNTKVRTGYFRDIVVRKRKSEIDHICGEIVRRGERAGVPTPFNRQLAHMFEEIESGRRPLGWENLEQLRAAVG